MGTADAFFSSLRNALEENRYYYTDNGNEIGFQVDMINYGSNVYVSFEKVTSDEFQMTITSPSVDFDSNMSSETKRFVQMSEEAIISHYPEAYITSPLSTNMRTITFRLLVCFYRQPLYATSKSVWDKLMDDICLMLDFIRGYLLVKSGNMDADFAFVNMVRPYL